MQVLAEITLAVLHQAHQTIGARHGIGAIVEIVVVGQMKTMRVGERNSLQQPSWDVGTGFVGGIEGSFITL